MNAGVLPLLENDARAATVRLQGQIPPGIEIREEDNLALREHLNGAAFYAAF